MAEKVGDAYVELGTRDRNFNRGMARAEKRTRGFASNGLVTIATITAIGAAMGKLIKLSNTQEDAERDIGAALRAHGDEAERLLPILKKQAAAIQKLTRFGDEQNLQTMATLRNLGVQGDALGTATKQAIGLAKALGLDSNAAAKYTALARQGEFTILQRYVPALRSATSEAEKQAIVTDLMNKGWKQAQESAQTTSGQIDQLANAFGDLGETIGELFKKGGTFEKSITDARILIEDLDQAIKDLNDTSSKTGKSTNGIGSAFLDSLRVAAGFVGALSAGSTMEEAAEIAFNNIVKDAMDRAKRRAEMDAEDIEGDTGGGGGDGGGGGRGRRRPGTRFAFTSLESAVKNIQTGAGKDPTGKEQKKQTKIMSSIDDGIKEVAEKIGATSPVGV